MVESVVVSDGNPFSTGAPRAAGNVDARVGGAAAGLNKSSSKPVETLVVRDMGHGRGKQEKHRDQKGEVCANM